MTTPSLAAGLDLGGTKVLGRVLHPADPRRALAEARVDTPRGGDAIVAAMVDLVGRLDDQLGAAGHAPVAAVGLGAAGLVDTEGVLRTAPNLPGVVEFPFGAALGAALGRPVRVENDATTATLAEHRLGAGRGASDLVLVTLGTGIGSGVIAGGELQRGAHGFAGEAGHMLVDPHGPPCPCGQRGCWERFASGSGLGRLARDAAQAGRADGVVARAGGDPEQVRGEHVGRAALDGDAEALTIVDDFAWWVALGLANIVNLLDCGLVIIGGGLVDMGDLLLAPVRRSFGELVLAAPHRPDVRIVAAELGSDAGAAGAWLLADEARPPA